MGNGPLKQFKKDKLNMVCSGASVLHSGIVVKSSHHIKRETSLKKYLQMKLVHMISVSQFSVHIMYTILDLNFLLLFSTLHDSLLKIIGWALASILLLL